MGKLTSIKKLFLFFISFFTMNIMIDGWLIESNDSSCFNKIYKLFSFLPISFGHSRKWTGLYYSQHGVRQSNTLSINVSNAKRDLIPIKIEQQCFLSSLIYFDQNPVLAIYTADWIRTKDSYRFLPTVTFVSPIIFTPKRENPTQLCYTPRDLPFCFETNNKYIFIVIEINLCKLNK